MKPLLSPTRFRRAVATAARVFDVSEQDVLGPARHRPIARARLAVYAALYTACATSYPELATYVRRDHTTVMHGVETAHRLARQQPSYHLALVAIADAARQDDTEAWQRRILDAATRYCAAPCAATEAAVVAAMRLAQATTN